jgi:hypothetical protein
MLDEYEKKLKSESDIKESTSLPRIQSK